MFYGPVSDNKALLLLLLLLAQYNITTILSLDFGHFTNPDDMPENNDVSK